MHAAALSAAGIDIRYDPVDVPPDRLSEVLRGLFDDGAGGNVTIPHKRAVHDRCDQLSSVAKRAGAVNTFWRDGTRLVGHNTDVDGFDSAARSLLGEGIADARVVVIGAGGAAAAVLTALERWPGGRTTITARRRSQAAELAKRFDVSACDETDLPRALGEASVVVNATPVGMEDDAHPADLSPLRHNATVIDLVYKPGETAWVRAARRSGRRAVDGLPMLIEQGALAFESWFGIEADRPEMRRALG